LARIRSIKPEFWIDEKVVELSSWARLLFIGLWSFADDQGYVDDKPRRIKMQIFPNDDLDVDVLLDELFARGMLDPFTSPVGPVFRIRNWTRHQKVDRAATPRFDEASLISREHSTSPRESSPASVETPQNGHSTSPREGSLASVDAEGKGSGRDLEGKGSTATTSLPALPADASITQRSKTITDAYAAVQPMCRWPAVNGVVIKAIKANRYADDEIHAALQRLAADGRSVTIETLRVELEGLAPRGSPNGAKPSTTDQRVQAGLALAAKFDLEDRKEIPP